jgi:transcription initiation factor TFIID subunit 12
MHVPGFGGEEVPKFPSKRGSETHAKRLAAVRRSVAAATAAQNEQRKQARLAAERAARKGGDGSAEDV